MNLLQVARKLASRACRIQSETRSDIILLGLRPCASRRPECELQAIAEPSILLPALAAGKVYRWTQ
jgi:hypothetical protein